jgi:hypothetical protein
MARIATTNTTLAIGEDYLWGDATSGSMSVTLPALPGVAEAVFIIFKADITVNTVTITAAEGDTIMNDTAVVLTMFGQTATIVAGPAQWWLL